MAKDYVQKYIWRDYGQPFLKAWQITLTADEAVLFLAVICVLITYTQAKTWSLARRGVIRIVRPIQLPLDDGDPNSLARLSQYEATSRLLSEITRAWRHRRPQGNSQSILRSADGGSMRITKISPLFGILAIANMALFVVMGVLVPWLLTGGLETAIIQSRWCAHFEGGRVPTLKGLLGGDETYFDLPYYTTNDNVQSLNLLASADAYQRCWRDFLEPIDDPATVLEKGPCAREKGPIMDRPPIRVTHPGCDALVNRTCVLDDLSKFQVYHEDLTLRDYGLNVASSAFTHSRLLTCIPRREFQVSILESHRDVGEAPTESGDLQWNMSPAPSVATIDRPRRDNRRTVTSSLTIQSYVGDGRLECPDCASHLDGHFHHDQGESFIIMYGQHNMLTRRRGRVVGILFDHGEGPPIRFASRRYYSFGVAGSNDQVQKFGIATCQEQHKICLEPDYLPKNKSGGLCTPFSNALNAIKDMFRLIRIFEEDGNEPTKALTAKEQLEAFSDLFYRSSTISLLQQEAGDQATVYPWTDSYTSPWTFEVLKWFEGALLQTQLNIHTMITGNLLGLITSTDEVIPNVTAMGWKEEDEATLKARRKGTKPYIPRRHMELFCRSGLVLDSDYTNINLAGLVMAPVVMILINTACHWQGHKTFAKAAAQRVVTTLQNAISLLKNVGMGLSLVCEVALTQFVHTSSSPSAPVDHRTSQLRPSRRHQDSTNEQYQGTQIGLTPRSQS